MLAVVELPGGSWEVMDVDHKPTCYDCCAVCNTCLGCGEGYSDKSPCDDGCTWSLPLTDERNPYREMKYPYEVYERIVLK